MMNEAYQPARSSRLGKLALLPALTVLPAGCWHCI